MYVTRSLSTSRRLLSNGFVDKPNDGPCSGYLVITDQEGREKYTCCWGTCETDSVTKFPFPQDRVLNFEPDNEDTATFKLWFIPVLDLPLSYNIYYVMRADGKYQGLSCVCSREHDKVQSCFGTYTQDLKPRSFNYRDVDQRFRILSSSSNGMFYAQSAASGGFPPGYLSRKSWQVHSSSSYQPKLEEASGLDASLRACLPDLNFPISNKCSDSVIVGKWYCPFVFFMEDGETHEQMKRSMFYKMVLQQRWEKIYTCKSMTYQTNEITINVNVQTEDITIFGMKAKKDDIRGLEDMVWFRAGQTDEISWRGIRWGMSTAIFEKMKWVQEEGGYVYDENRAMVENVAVAVDMKRGTGPSQGFSCYVLVESFVLTRLDGSTVMTYEFWHTQKTRTKWD
ncbi:hypothetical protein MLD38_022577 [Melastoma candidum]|uniref:Uncharacterized protein n=1 Tax=Melastoma candidum TaxID=119954 RepID=A0ACB9QIV6_9MYRT|nr:hypothetical protein MLD38_022577 [Melastoma candidum]